MKKAKIIAAALLIGLLSALSCVAFAGCSSRAAKTTGLYFEDNIALTGSPDDGATKNPSSFYRLELFDDGTYELSFTHWWVLGYKEAMTPGKPLELTYGRNVVSYGEYTQDSADEAAGTITVSLALPTRVQMVAFFRDNELVAVDSDNWPMGNEAEGIQPGISYKLQSSADAESWETAEEFVKGYGKEYTAVCTGTTGQMDIELKDGYEQIPFDNAVFPVE